MPLFTYKCNNCGITKRKIVKVVLFELSCKKCGTKMNKSLFSCPSVNITEKKNHYKNKNVTCNMEEITKKRSKEHFIEHNIDEAIGKAEASVGKDEAIKMAQRFGWLKSDGTKKKKVDLK